MAPAINLVYATDARGVLGLAVSSWSAVLHLPEDRPVNVWVLEQELRWDQRLRIAETLRSTDRRVATFFIPIHGNRFRHLLRSKSVPHIAYARLVMGEVLPPSVERCVYLDIDTACTTSLEPLHDMDLSGMILGAVPDSTSEDEGRKQFARLGIQGSRYFNSGVMVCDLAAWRQADLGRRALEFAQAAGSRLVLWDQDALNAVLNGTWATLPSRWNRWASSGLPLEDCIVHYTMNPKPWHANYRGRGGALFLEFLDQTAFRGTRPWNPLGLGAAAGRLRALMPYPPTVLRLLRDTLRRRTE